jgi:hypothetical protein
MWDRNPEEADATEEHPEVNNEDDRNERYEMWIHHTNS